MVDGDTSGDAAAVVTGKQDPEGKSATYHKKESPVTTNARTLDEPSVWLGILQDWMNSAQKAGLKIELTDLRPSDDACALVLIGVYFCSTCHNFSMGDKCRHCDTGGKAAP